MNEQSAFEGLKQGERAALDWTFRHTRNVCVPYYMARYKISKDDALDLFSDALIKMAARLEGDAAATLTARLSTVVNNFAHFTQLEQTRDVARWQKKWLAYQHEAMLATDIDAPSEAEEFEAFLNQLEQKVEELGDPCQSLIHDRFWANLSFREIAEKALKKLGLSEQHADYAEKLRRKIDALKSQMKFCIGKLK